MATARLVDELVATAPTRVGLLADVTNALAAAGVDIRAIMGWEMEGAASFTVVADDTARATEALRDAGFEVTTEKVVAVEMPDRPGALDEAASRIAEAGINIDWMYATTSGGGTATVLFKTGDDDAVTKLF
jgi:hypothetical protein